MASSSKRECMAKDCTRKVPNYLLMCPRHWKLVPKHIQTIVWRFYQPGQEDGKATPSRPYWEAVKMAVKAVAKAEGKDTEAPLFGTVEDDASGRASI